MKTINKITFAFFVFISCCVAVYQFASQKPKIFHVSKKPILALSWILPEQTIECVSSDGKIHKFLGDSLSGNTIQTQSKKWSKAVLAGEGKYLFATDSVDTELWFIPSSKSLWRRRMRSKNVQNVGTEISALSLSTDAKHLTIAEIFGNHGSVWVWDIKGGHIQPSSKEGICAYPDVAENIAISPNGKLVAYGGETPGIGVWGRDVHHSLWGVGSFTTTNRPRLADAIALCFSPDGQLLAASFLSGETMLLKPRTGSVVRTLPSKTTNRVLMFSPDSHLLSAGDGKGRVKIWNVVNGRAIIDAPSGTAQICSLAFSPDNTQLAIGTSSGDVQLWRVK
ncbi:hypothetical protein IAD21_01838 [Abditibacteriota bacterium]|nr:hypothetical protein IAD21_01838 [Abditibacteriota bacterium]